MLLPPDEKVTIFGLKARPEVNGRQGAVRPFDAAKGLMVELKDDGVGAVERRASSKDVTPARAAHWLHIACPLTSRSVHATHPVPRSERVRALCNIV